MNARTAKHGNCEFLRAPMNSRDPNRIGHLTLGGYVSQRLGGDRTGGHRPTRLSAKRMPNRGLEVVPTEDDTGVREKHVAAVRLGPYVYFFQNALRIVDGSSGSRDLVLHPKSPRAAWPSTSRTSTGTPTCSLIFTASADPIVGIRARSFGFAFCRSRRRSEER